MVGCAALMFLFLYRKMLIALLVFGVFASIPTPVSAAGSDDDSSEVRKTKKKKKKKKKLNLDIEEEEKEPVAEAPVELEGQEEPAYIPTEAEMKKTALGGRVTQAARKVRAQQQPQQEKMQNSPEAERAQCIYTLRKDPASIEHEELTIVHRTGTSKGLISQKHRVLLTRTLEHNVATVLSMTAHELRVKWDGGEEETFLKQGNATYMLASMVRTGAEGIDPRVQRVANQLYSRKAVAWEDYGWINWLIDTICGNEKPLTYETFKLENNDKECKVRFSEEERTIVCMSGDHEAAEVLGYTGVKLHIQWASGAVESYKRQDDGTYRIIDDARVARQIVNSRNCVHEKAEDDWFIIWWRDFMNEEKQLAYINVDIRKEKKTYRARLCRDNRVLVLPPPHEGWAKVVRYDLRRLVIRWDGTKEELFERSGDNVYHFVK